jgi:hypothetical protein
MYQLFRESEAAASVRKLKDPMDRDRWESSGNDADYLSKLWKLLAKMDQNNQKLLLHVAQKGLIDMLPPARDSSYCPRNLKLEGFNETTRQESRREPSYGGWLEKGVTPEGQLAARTGANREVAWEIGYVEGFRCREKSGTQRLLWTT